MAAAAAAAAAAAPMLAWAASITAQRPVIYLDGDPALDELALINSTHFAQLVGNYSRFGWWHPGPAWFYALDIVYRPLGGESWAFAVAVAVFQAVAALLVLFACWRLAGLRLVATGSALLLVYYALVGDQLFRGIWPPYLVMLPMLLLLLLAALAAGGSTPALAGLLVAGSFEVQTHVGTGPAVVAVIGASFIVRAALDRLARQDASWKSRPAGRFTWPLTLAGLVLTVVMWIPPLADEVTGHPGNLTELVKFFLANRPSRGFRAALSALGRYVDPLEFPKLTAFGNVDVSAVSNVHVAVAVAFAAACAALAIAGWWRRDRLALGLGVILLLDLAAITFAIRDIAGPVYYYLLLWVTTLPLALLLGAAELVLMHGPAVHLSRTVRAAAVVVAAVVLAAMGVVQTDRFLGLAPDQPFTQHLDQLSASTESALAAYPSAPVVVEPANLATWPTAAGVALQLLKEGHPVRVEPNWVFMFGKQSRLQGDEQWEVVVLLASEATSYQASNPDATLVASTGEYSVFLRKIR